MHSVLKTLVALLNSEGSTLLIGVSDTKEIFDLETDFSSFPKPDKLDEFQKRFDNLIARNFGNHSHHYLKVDFPAIEGKTVCALTINGKSAEQVYITVENGKEYFYFRHLTSMAELKLSEIANILPNIRNIVYNLYCTQ